MSPVGWEAEGPVMFVHVSSSEGNARVTRVVIEGEATATSGVPPCRSGCAIC